MITAILPVNDNDITKNVCIPISQRNFEFKIPPRHVHCSLKQRFLQILSKTINTAKSKPHANIKNLLAHSSIEIQLFCQVKQQRERHHSRLGLSH